MINVIGEQMFEEVREKVARGKYDDDQRWCNFYYI